MMYKNYECQELIEIEIDLFSYTCRIASWSSSMPSVDPRSVAWLILLQGWRKKAGIQSECHHQEKNGELSGILCPQYFVLCLLRAIYDYGLSILELEEARMITSRQEHGPY